MIFLMVDSTDSFIMPLSLCICLSAAKKAAVSFSPREARSCAAWNICLDAGSGAAAGVAAGLGADEALAAGLAPAGAGLLAEEDDPASVDKSFAVDISSPVPGSLSPESEEGAGLELTLAAIF